MKRNVFFKRVLIGVIVLMMVPYGAFAQGDAPAAAFTAQELDQMLAPVALYPDSLLAQILIAATYPDQVLDADRWLKANAALQGEALNAALDGMAWDLSVKALAPFPQVRCCPPFGKPASSASWPWPRPVVSPHGGPRNGTGLRRRYPAPPPSSMTRTSAWS